MTRDAVYRILTPAFIVISGIFIILAASGDFWLDEIWSLNLAKAASSPLDVVTKIHQDNNHILNTLFLYFLGEQNNWRWYRAGSVLCGLASLVVISFASIRKDPVERAATVGLAALSYPLILYFSEARGYAALILMSLLSFVLIQSYWANHSRRDLFFFWTASILGFLSHSTFLITYLSLAAWTIVHEMRSARSGTAACNEIVKCHLFPSLFAVWLYFVFIRNVVVGGGPVYSVWNVIQTLVALTLGVTEKGTLAWVGVGGAFMIMGYGVIRLWKEKSDHWVFFLCIFLLAPMVILTVDKPVYLYFRYFIVCVPFFYLLAGYLAGTFFEKGRANKIILMGLLILFMVGQAGRIVPLLTLGRGHYFNAVKYLSDNTNGDAIVVGSDYDFRNKTLLDFYSRYLTATKRVDYVDLALLPIRKPEWFIMQSLDRAATPDHEIEIFEGGVYSLSRSFLYCGTSGCNWFIYHRKPS